MNAGLEEFEGVKKLLALKRYEQPPPGYFNGLPGKILARIAAEDVPQGLWQRLLAKLILKPSTAYAFGLALCGVFVVGVGYTLQTGMEESAAVPAGDDGWRITAPASTAPLAAKPFAESVSIGGRPLTPEADSSTNPVIQTEPLIFEGLQLRVQPAGYSLGGQ